MSDQNFPKGFVTRFEPYCDNCHEFEEDSIRKEMFCDDQRIGVETIIFCKHEQKCLRIYNHLKKYMKERMIANDALSE